MRAQGTGAAGGVGCASVRTGEGRVSVRGGRFGVRTAVSTLQLWFQRGLGRVPRTVESHSQIPLRRPFRATRATDGAVIALYPRPLSMTGGIASIPTHRAMRAFTPRSSFSPSHRHPRRWTCSPSSPAHETAPEHLRARRARSRARMETGYQANSRSLLPHPDSPIFKPDRQATIAQVCVLSAKQE